MPKYKLIAGSHFSEGGKENKPGDVIELDEHTAALFVGKFERVGDSEPVTKPVNTGKPTAPVKPTPSPAAGDKLEKGEEEDKDEEDKGKEEEEEEEEEDEEAPVKPARPARPSRARSR